MLKGKDFGAAIGRAIQMKLDSGAVRTKAEIARHFDVKPPSVEDWIKKGSIEKDKLSELWRYFSDVAGPEHWGMTKAEWPAGLSAQNAKSSDVAIVEAHKPCELTLDEKTLLAAFRALSPPERGYLLEDAKKYSTRRK